MHHGDTKLDRGVVQQISGLEVVRAVQHEVGAFEKSEDEATKRVGEMRDA